MKRSSRSALIFPAWGLILMGSGAFIYCASAGMLGA